MIPASVVGELVALPGVISLRSGAQAIYFGIGSTSDVIEVLVARGFQILGMEGVTCDGVRVSPVIDCIADLSAVTEDVRALARDIVDSWMEQAEFVEIVAVSRRTITT